MDKYTFSVTNGDTGEYIGELTSESSVFPGYIMVESMDDGEEVDYKKEEQRASKVNFGLINHNPEYINFGDMVRKRTGVQCQYMSRYLHGKLEGWPNLAKGIRIKGDPMNQWYSILIHKDDVEEFLERYHKYLDESK